MHMLGREIKVTVTPPDGDPATLIAINDWDYNWQETYYLKQPMPLKKGTKLTVDAVYDNSAKNNPNRPVPARREWVVLRRADGQRDVFRLPGRHVQDGGPHQGSGRWEASRSPV